MIFDDFDYKHLSFIHNYLKYDDFKWSYGIFWMIEDWRKNWSLISLQSKQSLTKIGMLHDFANFRQRKSSQAETREQVVTDFWDPIHPKKVPSVIFATILKKTGLFLWHFHVPWILEQFFDITFTTADYFHLGIEIRGLFLLQYLI